MNWSTLLIIRFDIFVLYYESFIIIFHTIFYPIYLFIRILAYHCLSFIVFENKTEYHISKLHN